MPGTHTAEIDWGQKFLNIGAITCLAFATILPLVVITAFGLEAVEQIGWGYAFVFNIAVRAIPSYVLAFVIVVVWRITQSFRK